MTAAEDTSADPVAQFVRALPVKMRARFNVTATVVSDIHKATARGWTTAQLIDVTTNNHGGAVNVGGIIAHRLHEKCAPNEAPTAVGVTALRRPFCSPECKDNAGWVLDQQGTPLRRCPCRTMEATT